MLYTEMKGHREKQPINSSCLICLFYFCIDLHKEALYSQGRMGGQTAAAVPDSKDQSRSDDGWSKWKWQVQCMASAP